MLLLGLVEVVCSFVAPIAVDGGSHFKLSTETVVGVGVGPMEGSLDDGIDDAAKKLPMLWLSSSQKLIQLLFIQPCLSVKEVTFMTSMLALLGLDKLMLG